MPGPPVPLLIYAVHLPVYGNQGQQVKRKKKFEELHWKRGSHRRVAFYTKGTQTIIFLFGL